MPFKARNKAGEPCRAPDHLVDATTGLCPAHAPEGRERMAELGRKGAQATAERYKRAGLEPDELGPLKNPEDARRWLELIGQAVAAGRLPNRDGQVAVRAVEAFLRAFDVGELTDRIRELEAQLKKLKRVRAA